MPVIIKATLDFSEWLEFFANLLQNESMIIK